MSFKRALIGAAALAAFNAHAGLTFSEAAAGAYGGPVLFTTQNSHVASPISGSVTNVRLAPLTLSATDPYSVITTGGVATLDFGDTGVSSFKFLWGSPDSYNFIDIAYDDGSMLTFSGTDLGLLADPDFLANGNNANTRLLTIGTNGGSAIDSITFRSNGKAFEIAAAVPEPSTYALMLAGIAAIGFMIRRRRS